MGQRLSEEAEARFWENVAATEAFFMGTDPVHAALQKLGRALDETGVLYAIAGAMALNEYGYRSATTDVAVLLTAEGLARFKARWLGRGRVRKPDRLGLAISGIIIGDQHVDGDAVLGVPETAAAMAIAMTSLAIGSPRLAMTAAWDGAAAAWDGATA